MTVKHVMALCALVFGLFLAWSLGNRLSAEAQPQQHRSYPEIPSPEGASAEAQAFVDGHPGTLTELRQGRVARLTGPALSLGENTIQSTTAFVQNHAQLLGVPANELKLGRPNATGQAGSRQVLYDRETGQYKFSVVHYSQVRDGIPTFGANAVMLVRNEPGYPVVRVSSRVHDLGDFRPDLALGRDPIALQAAVTNNRAPLLEALGRDPASPMPQTARQYKPVIWPPEEGQPARLAAEFVVDAGPVHKWLMVVDTASGEVLFKENLVTSGGNGGNPSSTQHFLHEALIHPGIGPFQCAGQGVFTDWREEGMPFATSTTQFNSGTEIEQTADASGSFSRPITDGTTVNWNSYIANAYFKVWDEESLATIEKFGSLAHRHVDGVFVSPSYDPAYPAGEYYRTLVHHDYGTEYIGAELQAFYHANQTRQWVLNLDPNYPGTDQTVRLDVNVAWVPSGHGCGAYYDPSTDPDRLIFFRDSTDPGDPANKRCTNWAERTIIAHEYGHLLHDSANSTAFSSISTALKEGTADTIAMLATKSYVFGFGVYYDAGHMCENPGVMRNAHNDIQYDPNEPPSSPCVVPPSTDQGPGHYCGQILSGTFWDLVIYLTSYSSMALDDAFETASVLFLAMLQVHDDGLEPSIYGVVINLDDDDGNIWNGTPNCMAIERAFNDHNLLTVPLGTMCPTGNHP